jgi:hypothetical protein
MEPDRLGSACQPITLALDPGQFARQKTKNWAGGRRWVSLPNDGALDPRVTHFFACPVCPLARFFATRSR